MVYPPDPGHAHCSACIERTEEITALREACEVAWTVIGAEPNVSPRARSRVMARLQAALRWGVFTREPAADE